MFNEANPETLVFLLTRTKFKSFFILEKMLGILVVVHGRNRIGSPVAVDEKSKLWVTSISPSLWSYAVE